MDAARQNERRVRFLTEVKRRLDAEPESIPWASNVIDDMLREATAALTYRLRAHEHLQMRPLLRLISEVEALFGAAIGNGEHDLVIAYAGVLDAMLRAKERLSQREAGASTTLSEAVP